MRYEPLPVSFYVGNRARLAEQLKPGSLAVLNSNDVYPTNADGTMGHCQNTDLFYLTGVDQEETILLLCPDAPDKSQREILFVRETNEMIAIWEGAKLTKEAARELTGIQNVQWLQNFDAVLTMLVKQMEYIYLNNNEHLRCTNPVQTRDARFAEWVHKSYPNHKYERLAPLLGKMRQFKQPEEIAAIQKACDITGKAVRRLLKFIRPGVAMWEIEAELAHEFIRHGARRWGFHPILACGRDTCVLHFITNDTVSKDGDLILTDIGTEYGNYNSDLTRTFPANGKFTPRQREVYQAVHRIMKEAFGYMRPGVLKKDYEAMVGKYVEKELLGLGLLTEDDIASQDTAVPAYRRYYMHGCSHFLGLDVHDVGESNPVFQPGMVFTIEPGIYIPEESIGIRLENDVLIGETENTDLMADIPIDIDEVERLMAEGRA